MHITMITDSYLKLCVILHSSENCVYAGLTVCLQKITRHIESTATIIVEMCLVINVSLKPLAQIVRGLLCY